MSVAAFTAPSSPNLHAGLAQAIQRVRLRRVLRDGATGLLAGSGVTVFVLGLLRLHVWASLDSLPDLAFLVPPLAGICVGIAVGVARRVESLAVLRFVEQALDLKDRLSTAHALAGVTTPFATRQIADAEATASASTLNFARAIPLFPLPRRLWAALGLSTLAFALWFVPSLPYFQSPTQKAEQVQLKKEGERLVRIAKALDKNADAKKLSGAKKTAARIAALGEEMQRGKMTRQQSLMKAAKLTEAVKQQQKEAALRAAQNNGGKSLPLAGRELAQTLDAADPKSQTMREAASALSHDDTQSTAEQLSKLADETQNAPSDKASLDKRAKQTEALSNALKGTKLEKAAPKLKEAAEAMRRGDNKAAAEKLRQASQEAASAGDKGEDARAMEQAANALSEKDESGEKGDGGDQGQQNAAGKSGDSSQNLSEGAGKNDAFNKDGTMKQGEGSGTKGGGKEPGDGKSGVGIGKNSNGIGSEAGKPGGEKAPVAPAGPYEDANNAPKGNKSLNRKTEKTPISNDQYSRLYAPNGKMPATRVTGKRGAKGQESVGFYRGAPDKGSSSVPYYEVYGQYAPATENALHRDDIPAAYKKQVRDYFDSIRPGTTKPGDGKGKK